MQFSSTKEASINHLKTLPKRKRKFNHDLLYANTFPLPLGFDISALGMKCLANALLIFTYNKLNI